MQLTNLPIRMIPTNKASKETWNEYLREHFYLSTQAWQWDCVVDGSIVEGDAIVGIGPGYSGERNCCVTVRMGDKCKTFHGKDISISSCLETYGFKSTVQL